MSTAERPDRSTAAATHSVAGLRTPAPLLVVGSVLGVQIGQALGKQMFATVGPAGVATVRLGLAALVLLAIWRPRVPTHSQALRLIAGLGTAIAGMNVIYPAMSFLPLGVASALQLLGPLTVALLASRRRRDVVWTALAGAGILLLHDPGGAELPVVGVVLALVSAVAMGCYLLLSRRAGARDVTGSTLALAVTWAAVLCVPFGIAESGGALLQPTVLAAGFGLALLSAVLPYSLDLAALRRLPARIVGVLQSLEPVVGALAGLLILGEHLSPSRWIAVGCIAAASTGAVLARRSRRRAHPRRRHRCAGRRAHSSSPGGPTDAAGRPTAPD